MERKKRIRRMLTDLSIMVVLVLAIIALSILAAQQQDFDHERILGGVAGLLTGITMALLPFFFIRERAPRKYPEDWLRRAQGILWMIPLEIVAVLLIGTTILTIAAGIFHFYFPPELWDVYKISVVVISIVAAAALVLTIFNIFRLKERFEL